jgi:hypothetical protein
LLGQQQTHTQKKEKRRNEMEKKADQLNKDDPQPLRPPEKYHHAPSIESLSTKQHLQEGKQQRCCPDQGHRVSPDTQREVDEG